MIAWPCRLKVASDRSARRPSASSTPAHPPQARAERARLPGAVQQVPAHPGRRQHAHELQQPRAHPALVVGLHRLKWTAGPPPSPRGRVGLPRLPGKALGRPAAPATAPGRSHSSGAGWRSPAACARRQRQPPQLARHRHRLRASTSPVRTARNAAASAGVNTSTRTQAPRPATDRRFLVITTRAAPQRRDIRPQHIRISCVIEHDQAAVPVGLQPVRTTWPASPPPAPPARQPRPQQPARPPGWPDPRR